MDTRGPATDGHSSKLVNDRHLGFAIWVILVFAALQIGRAAVSQNTYYIDLHQYAHMAVRPPFQNRILMAYVLAAVEHNRWFLALHHSLFSRTVDDPLDLASMLVNCACLVLLLPITVALRRAFAPPPASSWLAPALMLLVVAFTFVVRYEQRWTFPYDFPSMLFFNLGLWAVLARRGWLLSIVLAAAIPNRESVLFLVPAWFWLEWRERRRVTALVYSAIGAAVYVAWYLEIKRILHTPKMPYDFPWAINLHSLMVPTHWPQLVSVFGFLAIPMWLLRGYVTDPRLKALWLSLTPFGLAAVIVGIWYETRIFGELSSLAALTFALQLERAGLPPPRHHYTGKADGQ
jgi:hypothetical protein